MAILTKKIPEIYFTDLFYEEVVGGRNLLYISHDSYLAGGLHVGMA